MLPLDESQYMPDLIVNVMRLFLGTSLQKSTLRGLKLGRRWSMRFELRAKTFPQRQPAMTSNDFRSKQTLVSLLSGQQHLSSARQRKVTVTMRPTFPRLGGDKPSTTI
jgi:hypothetical protein